MAVRHTPAARRALGEATRQAEAADEVAAPPVTNPHACGIDVGDASRLMRSGEAYVSLL